MWDFLSWECILHVVNHPKAHPIIHQVASLHTKWWRCTKYQENKAACVLMAWLLLALGTMRLAWAIDTNCQLPAVLSYLLETFLIATELVSNRMQRSQNTDFSALASALLGLAISHVPRPLQH